MQTEVRAVFQGREATVLLRADGIAVRKLKQRSAGLHMRESAKLLCISKHPHLVRIFKVQDGDIHMEGMTVSLQERAPATHTLPFHAKLRVALAVARGIRHLHLHGMDHGDLCPSNILLAGETQVKLSDFYNENTGARRTAAYSSPEVVRAPQHTMCAADVWAFACCLLFLEGVEPFCGFEEDQAKLFYLGLNQCVAFHEGGVFKPFTLQDCAYAPARHAASSAWRDILAAAFVPEPSRLTSHEICEKLATLQAPPVRLRKTESTRVPFHRLNV
jgi:serine/threonine protein kinase